MSHLQKKSLKAYAKQNIILIALIFSGIFVVINLVPRTILRNDAINNTKIVTDSVKIIFNDTVNDIERSMDEVAMIVNHSNLTEEQMNYLLHSTINNYPLFTAFEIIDNKGLVIYAAPLNTVGMDRSGEKVYKLGKGSDQYFWSDVFTYFMSGDPVVSVTKEYDGVVYQGYIDLELFSANSTAIQKELSNQFDISVMDGNGTYLSNSNSDLIYQRVQNEEIEQIKDAVAQKKYFFESSDQKSLVSVSYVESLNWYIALRANKVAVFSAINMANLILFAATLLMASLLLVYYFRTNKISKLIQMFSEEINNFTYNKESIIIDEHFLELETLNRNFKNMSHELKHASDQLHNYAYRDILTGLFNRRAALDKINKYVTEKYPIVLCYFDLDRFKEINDKLGHSTGDRFLKMITSRLQTIVSNPENLFRVGGDEFIYIVAELELKDAVRQEIDRVLSEFKKPYCYEREMYYFGVSIGSSCYPEDADNVDDLLRFADIAMYQAKSDGTSYQIFNQDIQDKLIRKLDIEGHLRNRDFYHELSYVIQPQFEIRTGAIIGFEMFIRWNNSKLGFVSPDEFISIAENCYAINDITYWMFCQAMDVVKVLDDRYAVDYKVAINVSVIDLLSDTFVEKIVSKIKTKGVSPNRIELEITEGVIIENYTKIKAVIAKLSQIGFRIALDDFGKGYSSLSHLNELQINTLKIDKEFLDSAYRDDRSKQLLKCIIDISKKLLFDVIVEGVETKEQLTLLTEFNTYAAQGYLLSRPLSNDALYALLDDREKNTQC